MRGLRVIKPIYRGSSMYWLYTDKTEEIKIGVLINERGEIAWGTDILKGTMVIDSKHPRRSRFPFRWIDQGSL